MLLVLGKGHRCLITAGPVCSPWVVLPCTTADLGPLATLALVSLLVGWPQLSTPALFPCQALGLHPLLGLHLLGTRSVPGCVPLKAGFTIWDSLISSYCEVLAVNSPKGQYDSKNPLGLKGKRSGLCCSGIENLAPWNLSCMWGDAHKCSILEAWHPHLCCLSPSSPRAEAAWMDRNHDCLWTEVLPRLIFQLLLWLWKNFLQNCPGNPLWPFWLFLSSQESLNACVCACVCCGQERLN